MIHISVKVLILTFCFWLKTFLYPWPLFKKTWAHLGKATSHPNDGLLIQRETVKHKGPWAISLENICIKNNSLPPSFSTQLISTVVLMPWVTQTWIGICLIQSCSLEKRAQVWPLDVNNWNNAAQRIKICKSFLLLAESAPILWVFFVSSAPGNEGSGTLSFSSAETSMPWVVCLKLSPAGNCRKASCRGLCVASYVGLVWCVSIYSSKYQYSRQDVDRNSFG